MGLRCSLFGHAYGEPVTERDRERRGDEEVVTVRELRTCKRCGVEKVLSENTEVRHLDSAQTDPDPGSPVDREAGAEETAEQPESEPTEEDVDVAELVDAAEPDQSVPAGSADTAEETVDTEAGAAESETAEAADAEPETPEAEDGATSDDDEGAIIMDESSDGGDESLTGATETATAPEEGESAQPARGQAGPNQPAPGDAEADQSGPAQAEPNVDASEEKSDGVILGQDSDEEAVEPEGDEEPDAEPSGIDAVDDIDDMDSDEGPTDATASTAEPESMFGAGGDSQPSSDSAAGTGPAGAEERDAGQSEPRTDDWKEPLEEEQDSSTEDWDDPAFQFQPEPEEPEEPETGPRRGPAGITSDGPLDMDSGSDSPAEALVCPDCGYTETQKSSLRAGDICPECHRGYLAARQ